MANQEHLDILRQGVEVWNRWRGQHQGTLPNLSGADLFEARLVGADLREATLNGADFRGANLNGADLSMASLSEATLNGADLRGADLRGAFLSWANLSKASLNAANLNGADLIKVNLSGANLIKTNFSGATVGRTIFGDLDLRTVKGLETLEHRGPSTVGIDTIYRSGGNIPEVFLRGAGVDDILIEYMHSLVGKPIEYNSCFISYSSKDQGLAERLYADLQSNNVRCWYAPHDMKTGDRIRPRIYEQIWFNDKLLLILSESSVASEWVNYEVETAFAREHKEKQDILFPIRLDDAVIESTTAWAAHIQEARHITDFTRWKEYDEYQKGLNKLLRDLKQEAIDDIIESDAHKDQKQSTSRKIQS